MQIRWVISILATLLIVGCVAHQVNQTSLSYLHKARLPKIENYAVYYGSDKIDELSKFDLVILDPDNYSKDEIEKLKKNGTIVLAYLSLGEVNENRWYFEYAKKCIIGRNPTWGSYYINISCKTWKSLLLGKIIPKILEKGFDGLFLDTVDVVDNYPQFKDDMIDLIKSIRAEYPNIILIQNRGFSVIDETAKYVNGVLFECFTTHYNWSSGKYELWSCNDLNWVNEMALKLLKLRDKYDLIILALDYADNEYLKEKCIEHAKKFGFVPYVTTVDLTSV